MSLCPAELVAFAHTLGDTACDLLRQFARGPVAVETKSDGTPVTEVDRAVEAAVRTQIHHHFPAHGIIGEEFPAERADAPFVWIVDPLDGTKEFIQGLPLFGTLIALAHHGRIVLGLAEQPLTRDRWLGADGHGTTWNGATAHVRPCESLSQAVLSTMGYDSFCPHRAATLAPLRARARNTVTADSFVVFGLLAIACLFPFGSFGCQGQFVLFAIGDHFTFEIFAGGSQFGLSSVPFGIFSCEYYCDIRYLKVQITMIKYVQCS